MPIGFLDADCFYVSAERIRHADLVGKPVAVVGNNGACVIAKSYEMKARGVRTGEPIWDAAKKCPEGVYLKRDFRWYEVLSRKILDVVGSYSPAVEYYSIDEMFFRLEVSPLDAPRVALAVRDRIRKELGLPVTVGIARTKTLAKLFAESVKPFGAVAVLDIDAEKKCLGSLSVDAVAGIAGRRAARLAAYGARTCLDFAHLPRKLVRSTLTVTGERLWEELNGQPATPIDTSKRPNKTISRGGGFTATSDASMIHAWLVRHVERLIEELDFHEMRASKLTVFVEHRDGPNGVGVAHLDVPANGFEALLDAAREAFAEAYLAPRAACRIDLLAEKLSPARCVQLSLFETPSEQWEAVARVKKQINAHFGRFALRSGATLPLYELYQDTAAGYDICDIRGKMCF